MPEARKVALVACASSGIGAVYAERLAGRGHDLLVARRSYRLGSLAEKLQADRGRTVDIVVADLSKEDDLARVDGLVGSHSALAVVVNNTGLAAKGAAATVDPALTGVLIDMNVRALTPGSLAFRRGLPDAHPSSAPRAPSPARRLWSGRREIGSMPRHPLPGVEPGDLLDFGERTY